jgi:hypothetical protein
MKHLYLFVIILFISFKTFAQCKVNAGPDQTICTIYAGSKITLSGTATGTTSTTWEGGYGTFSPNNTSLNVTYTVSPYDTSLSQLNFVLNGQSAYCSDTAIVRFVKKPLVNAGPDQSICKSSSLVSLSGSISNGVSGTWSSSGSGKFEDPSYISNLFYPSQADLDAGIIALILSSSTSNGCSPSSDTTIITFVNTASLKAGPDQEICETDLTINLSATVTGVSNVQWSTSGTGSFSNSTSANTNYVLSTNPQPSDTSKSVFLFTIHAQGTGACANLYDTIIVTRTKSPYVNAGYMQTICGSTVNLSGAIGNNGTGMWTTSGTGTFANASSPITSYTASAADLTAGSVDLTLTSQPIGTCSGHSAQITITYVTGSTADAGPDQTICGNKVFLSGIVSGSIGAKWTTTGTGTFSPSADYPYCSYTASASDISKGNVTFTLTTTGTNCTPASDQVIVTFTNAATPYAYAGPNQSYVTGNVSLHGTVTNATGGIWTTTGTGTFTSSTTLNTIYTPSPDDYNIGWIQFKLTTTGTNCTPGVSYTTVTLGNIFSLSGQVLAGTSALDIGKVFLYKKIGNSYDLVKGDSIGPSDNGQYQFDTLAFGQYLIYAVPSQTSSFAGTYIPTYYASGLDWTTATPINVPNSSIIKILLREYKNTRPKWNTGIDVIGGILLVNNGGNSSLKLAGTSTSPLANACVYLKDTNGEVVAYTLTDQNGAYSFINVEANNYFVSAEYPCAVISNPIPVATDGSGTSMKVANISAQKAQVTTAVLNGVSGRKEIQVSPNPALSSININLADNSLSTSNYKLVILDMMGETQIEKTVEASSGNSVNIIIENLPAGMYMLEMISGSEVYNSKFIKY